MSLAESASGFIALLTGDYVYTPAGAAVGTVSARIPGGGTGGRYAVNVIFNTGYNPSAVDYFVVKSDTAGKYMKVGLGVYGGFDDDPQVSGTATKIADLATFTPAAIGGTKPATITNPVRSNLPGAGASDAFSQGLNLLNTGIAMPFKADFKIPLWLLLAIAGGTYMLVTRGGGDE